MQTNPARAFAHCYLDNGKVESICLMCFCTVCCCLSMEQALQEEIKRACAESVSSVGTTTTSRHLQVPLWAFVPRKWYFRM